MTIHAIDGCRSVRRGFRFRSRITERGVGLAQVAFAEALGPPATGGARARHDRVRARTNLHHKRAANRELGQVSKRAAGWQSRRTRGSPRPPHPGAGAIGTRGSHSSRELASALLREHRVEDGETFMSGLPPR